MIYGVFSRTAGAVLRLLLRPRVEGRENVPARGPFILAANHLSFVDSFALSPVVGRRVAYLTRAEYFELPGPAGRAVRWALVRLGNVPIRRGPTRAAVRALERIAVNLDEGRGVGIYPEGSRSPDGRLYRGRTGVGWLALETGARVLPVALEGTEKIQPLGASLPRVFGPRPTVRIGPPMDFSHYRDMPPAKARRLIADEIIETIQKMSGQEYVPEYNGRAEAS